MNSEQHIDSSTLQAVAASVQPGQPWSAYQAAARALDRIPAESVPERLRARVALLGSFTLEPAHSDLMWALGRPRGNLAIRLSASVLRKVISSRSINY